MKIFVYAFTLLSSFGTLRFCSSDGDIITPTNVSVVEKWATEPVLKTPESALYDAVRRVIFGSNINAFHNDQRDRDGFISVLKPNGSVEKLDWVTGLNDPKGLAIWFDKLYVADIDRLVEIDIRKGKIANEFPIAGAVFLNDVTVDSKGTVYVSDTGGGKIYQLKAGVISVFAEGETVVRPNGLLAEKDKLLMASAGTGDLRFINYKTGDNTLIANVVANADGVVKDPIKNYIVSNWQGEVYYLFASGATLKILDTKDAGMNAADIGFIPEGNVLLVPTFFNNRIVAYHL